MRFNVVPSDPFAKIFVPFNLTFFVQILMSTEIQYLDEARQFWDKDWNPNFFVCVTVLFIQKEIFSMKPSTNFYQLLINNSDLFHVCPRNPF